LDISAALRLGLEYNYHSATGVATGPVFGIARSLVRKTNSRRRLFSDLNLQTTSGKEDTMNLFNRFKHQAVEPISEDLATRGEPGFMRTLKKPMVAGAIALVGATLLSRMRKR
jgi:hypothetical protein